MMMNGFFPAEQVAELKKSSTLGQTQGNTPCCDMWHWEDMEHDAITQSKSQDRQDRQLRDLDLSRHGTFLKWLVGVLSDHLLVLKTFIISLI